MQDEPDDNEESDPDEETKELMDDFGIDEDTAERAKEFIDEGLDPEDAIEVAEEM